MGPYAPLVRLAASAALAFALAAAPAAFALDENSYGVPLMSRLGTSDGLPNASVSGIVQDSQGFIWFGTQGGLIRYDGYSFKRFNHEPFDTESLPIDIIQTLFLDGRSLWVGTYAGLARMDLLTERFVSYASDPGDPFSLSGEVVTSIARDSRGSLWVGTLSGLNRLDESTGKFQRFLHDPEDPSSLPSDVVRAIKADSQGRLWIGTSGGGLARFNYAQGSFVSYKKESEGEPRRWSIPSDYVMAIEEDSKGRLWIGTWGTASGGAGGGFSLFDPSSGHFESHPTADGRVYALCVAEEGVVYAGTWGGGLFEYDIDAKRFVRYNASGGPGSLSSDIVYSFLRDKAGELWIGTNGGGLCKLGTARRGYEAIAAGEDGIPPRQDLRRPRRPPRLALGRHLQRRAREARSRHGRLAPLPPRRRGQALPAPRHGRFPQRGRGRHALDRHQRRARPLRPRERFLRHDTPEGRERRSRRFRDGLRYAPRSRRWLLAGLVPPRPLLLGSA